MEDFCKTCPERQGDGCALPSLLDRVQDGLTALIHRAFAYGLDMTEGTRQMVDGSAEQPQVSHVDEAREWVSDSKQAVLDCIAEHANRSSDLL